MPKTTLEELDRMYGRAKGRAALMFLAAAPRKTGASAWWTSKAPRKPADTVYGWLVRLHERGPNGASHDKHPGAACRPDKGQPTGLRADPAAGPAFRGLPSGARSARKAVDWAKKKYEVTCGNGGITRLPHRIGFACVKPRPRNPGAAPRDKAGEFKRAEREGALKYAKTGCVTLAGDASSFTMGLRVKRGWYPVDRDGDGKGKGKGNKKKRPTAPSTPSGERFNVFGVPGRDGFHHKFCDKVDGESFLDFVRELYEKYGKFVPYLDNAGHHKSKKANGCIEEGFGDDAAPKFFPPYTPEPNPVEIQRREIKRGVANEPFENAAAMKDAITKMPESGEIKTVKTFDRQIADARRRERTARGDGSRPRRDDTVGEARVVCARTAPPAAKRVKRTVRRPPRARANAAPRANPPDFAARRPRTSDFAPSAVPVRRRTAVQACDFQKK